MPVVDEWVTKIGVGKIEWARKWEQANVHSVHPYMRITRWQWTFSLKLTARMGGYFVQHTRITLEDHRLKAYPAALRDEIIVAHVELLLRTKQEDAQQQGASADGGVF